MTDLSSGISPLGPSKKVKAAVRRAVKEINSMPGDRLNDLRRLFSSKYNIDGKGLYFSNSLTELIYLIPEVFRPGKVLVAGPALTVYARASVASGAEVLRMSPDEVSGFAEGPAAFIKSAKDARMLFIANPNRVNGSAIDRRKLYDAALAAAESGVMVVIDETLVEFTGEDRFPPVIQGSDNLIVLRTTASFYGLGGLELAYAVSSSATAERLNRPGQGPVNILSIAAAGTAIRDSTYRKNVLSFINSEKQILQKAIARTAGMKWLDSGANLLLIRIEGDASALVSYLERKGFSMACPGDIEGLDNDIVRLSVPSHDQGSKLIKALEKFSARKTA